MPDACRRWIVDGFVLGRPHRFEIHYDPNEAEPVVIYVVDDGDLTLDSLEDMERRGIIQPLPSPRPLRSSLSPAERGRPWYLRAI